MSERFDFAFAASYRLPARLFGITPARAFVTVSDTELQVRFGPWHLMSPLDNITRHGDDRRLPVAEDGRSAAPLVRRPRGDLRNER